MANVLFIRLAFRDIARNHDNLRHLALLITDYAALRFNETHCAVGSDKAELIHASLAGTHCLLKQVADTITVFGVDLSERILGHLALGSKQGLIRRTVVDAPSVNVEQRHEIADVFRNQTK